MKLDSKKRLEREKAFHDQLFKKNINIRSSTSIFYSIARRSFSDYRNIVFSKIEEKPVRVLEYGCGKGSLAFELAKKGAEVVGIDISEVAVKNAIKKSSNLKDIKGKLCFKVMNAEDLEFPKEYFDIICGSAILHHLDLERAYSQLHKVLKLESKAVFLEPLGHNPLINLYRRLTPYSRTIDEHPLLIKDFNMARKYFKKVEYECYQLLTLFAVPFANTTYFNKLLDLLEVIEKRLFNKIPAAQFLAWSVIVSFSKKANMSNYQCRTMTKLI
ncbi:MAG: class I SAM-dependent methyltransferase [Proteobacteria bacterium]|nr:class I SAM-dependent methyltransferase [Pseudomonadota bacterium]MBU4286588.1 class I SAM-dependent methyltransferase [Pseudomonadota bacterium]MCG2758654.1 class I SAM-dependent methyltransferase [Desulfobacteraceae bacterium]